MAKIEELLLQREETYQQQTKDIFFHILHVLEGIVEVLGVHSAVDAKLLTWDNIVIVRSEKTPDDDGVVLVTGSILPTIGEMVTLPTGEEIEITKNTQEYFKRPIRAGVPISLAENGTKKEVVEFLQQIMENLEDEIEMEDLDDPELSEQPIPLHSSDFNLDDLTEEQRQSLNLFNAFRGNRN
jgi:hypothetical protein